MARNAWLLIYYRRASGQRQGSLSKPVASLHFLSCVISHDNSGREGKKLERKEDGMRTGTTEKQLQLTLHCKLPLETDPIFL